MQTQSPVEALNNFFAFLDVSPKTADKYRKALKQFMNYLNEHEIMHPQREDIIAFRKNLDCKRRKPATIVDAKGGNT